MGSWNGTCGISQLPIRHGDAVRVFLIGVPMQYKYGDDQSGYCYSDGWCYPISTGFKATYNDYGGVEKIQESFVTELIWDQYKDQPFFETQSNYPNPGRSVNLEQPIKVNGFESFLNDVVERDHLYLNKSCTTGAGLWMVHEAIYQAVLDREALQQVHNFETPRFLDAIRQELAKEAVAVSREAGADSRVLGKIRGMFGFVYEGELHALEVTIPEVQYQHYVRWPWMWRAQNGGTTRALKPYRQLLVDALEANDEAKVQKVVTAAAEFNSFCGAMEGLRKGWVPQPGKGSQSGEHGVYKQLITGMNQVIKADKRRWAEYDD